MSLAGMIHVHQNFIVELNSRPHVEALRKQFYQSAPVLFVLCIIEKLTEVFAHIDNMVKRVTCCRYQVTALMAEVVFRKRLNVNGVHFAT